MLFSNLSKWYSGILTGYGEPFNIFSFCPLIAVDLCTFLVLGKLLFGRFLISVDLPAADTLAVASLILYKAEDILRRIAKEQANLMWEVLLPAKSLYQPNDAFLAGFVIIAMLLKDLCSGRICKIEGQPFGAIDIDQCFVF